MLALQSSIRKSKKASSKISDSEVRCLVSCYYISQEDRKRFYNQERTLGDVREKFTSENAFLVTLAERAFDTEKEILNVLDDYTKEHQIGKWIRSVHGLGPVLAAGILAYIDITKVNHAGSIWVYAGINAEAKWKKGEKRPWNQFLKNLSWKIGESFNKSQNNEKSYYGKILKDRKVYEWDKNLKGEYKEQAIKILKEKVFSQETNAYQWYSAQYNTAIMNEKKEWKGIVDSDKGECFPMLPPAHIVSRVKRYTVKRFYSDLYVVWHETHYKKKAPLPYVIVSPKFPEHTTVVKPFNYESPYED